jgi:hypothetical protein
MDITTLQALIDESNNIVKEASADFDEANLDGLSRHQADIDYNYHLGIEHGIARVVRMLKDELNREVCHRDDDTQWIDYVVRSAIENNTFNSHYVSWDGAYDEAAKELDVDHNALCDAFHRVQEAA